MSKGVAILGSTGSIGQSALNVIERQRDRFRAVALTAFESGELLEQQAERFDVPFVGLVRGSTNGARMSDTGKQCLTAAATHPDVDIVINAIVGAAGLEATIAALKAGKRVALANKESLVMAGEIVLRAAAEGGGEIVPVDSEHSAILQCITGYGRSRVSRLILTASGGPFREWDRLDVSSAGVDDALNHPTWNMGRKITVDSATLANKALEVIEAHFLFSLGFDAIEVVVHPQSIVHAFVEFVDGSILAQVGFPDMELPILYALTHPDRLEDSGIERFDPVGAGPLSFENMRTEVFPAFGLGVAAGRTGGTAPTVFNAANEAAVGAFLNRSISFGRIPELIAECLRAHEVRAADTLETVIEADRWARGKVAAACS
ncbi:MAG: 1-deoxy-D-xylulose-5-phosphate reductoisomerase [Gemmatimonadales bacterium]